MKTAVIRTGGCHCGQVQYRITGPMREIIGCHCTQCRRTTGHFLTATAVRRTYFELIREDGLTWFRASDEARRGFCGSCGSKLFWARDGGDSISVVTASLDDTSDLKIAAHIFVGGKPTYYDLEPDIPAHLDSSCETVPIPE